MKISADIALHFKIFYKKEGKRKISIFYEKESKSIINIILDAILFIAFDEGIDMNMINFIMDDLVEPPPNYLAVRRRNQKISNQNYFENIIPRYTDVQFAKHFRMSRITFEVIIKRYIELLNI